MLPHRRGHNWRVPYAHVAGFNLHSEYCTPAFHTALRSPFTPLQAVVLRGSTAKKASQQSLGQAGGQQVRSSTAC